MTDIDELRATCPECGFTLASNGGCYYPDCSDPKLPEKPTPDQALEWLSNNCAISNVDRRIAADVLRDELAALRSAQQWRGVESAPRDGAKFWARNKQAGYYGCLSYSDHHGEKILNDHGFQYVCETPEPDEWCPMATGDDQ